MGFHLDEHVDPSIARALRRAGIDVTTTNEVGLRSADDQTHFQFACAEGRVIVTRDTDFLRFGREDSDHPGIVFYSAHDSLREIIEGLILIYEALDPGEMCGHIEYL